MVPSRGLGTLQLPRDARAGTWSPSYGVGGVGGFFDEIGDFFEGVRDIIKDTITLKYIRKGFRWAWSNMPDELRGVVLKIGPLAAGAFGGPFASTAAELALGLLEQDRHSREERKRFKRELEATIKSYEEQGLLEPGVINIKNPEHLEAIVLAAQLPPDLVDDWFRQRGLAPPPRPGVAGASRPVLVLAAAVGLVAAGAYWQRGRAA